MTPQLAANGDQGLQAVVKAQQEKSPFRLVLFDSALEGEEIASLLQPLESGDGPQPIAIRMQPDGMPASLLNGEQQAEGTIYKPILRRALIQKLEEALSERTNAATHPTKAPLPKTNLAGKRLLVVEDNDVNRSIFIKMLMTTGCLCEGAVDGHHAVELVQQKEFDLIFMDLHMPRMGGIEATQNIRASEPEGRHTPIIALTADAISGVEAECLAAGMDSFLTKPIRFKDLSALLEDHFHSHSTHE